MDDATSSRVDWRELVDAIPFGVGVQVGAEFVHVSEAFAEALGADAAALAGEPWRTPFEPAAAGRLEREAIPAARNDGTWTGAVRVPRTDADRLELTVSATGSGALVWGADPNAARVPTPDRSDEHVDRFDDRAGFLRTLIDAVDDVLYVIDENGDFRLWNETLVETTGYSHEEISEMDPQEFVPADQQEYLPGLLEAIEAFEDRRVDVDILTAAGERIPHEFRGTTFADPETGERYRVGLARDVSDRLARERELERYETVVETMDDGVYVLDEDLRFSFVSDRFCEMFGASRDEVIGKDGRELFEDAGEADEANEARERLLDDGGDIGTIHGTVSRDDGEQFLESRYRFHPEPEDGEFRGSVGVVRDVTEREARHEELRRQRTLIEGILNTIPDVVFAFDDGGEPIVEEAMLEEFAGYAGDELAELGPLGVVADADRPAVMEQISRVLIEGESVTYETDIATKNGREIPHEFRAAPFEMREEVQGVVGSARDVTERVERERALERQRDELETLDEINQLLLETNREVIQSASREAVERAVCERLAASDLYRFAWVGERAFDGDHVVSRVSAGEDDGYLDAVTITADESATGRGPTGRALRTGDVHVASVEDPASDPWKQAAAERDIESVAAVPLQHDDAIYGVLVVYADREDAFSLREQSGFDVLGRSVGTVIHAARSHDLLFADSVVELEFRIEDDDSPFVRAAATYECELSLEGYVASGNRWILYLDVLGAAPATLVDGLVPDEWIERARTISEGENAGRLELVVGESALLDTVRAAGASVRDAAADEEGFRLVVEAPRDGDVRGIVDHVHASYADATLIANRERDREVATGGRPGGVLDELTDRQREVLKAAYRAGYFAWPRESTAEEIAASLDLTAPTVHGHLRKAERAILSELVTGG